MAVTAAPRISDCEIVERLTRLEEGQKALRIEMNQRFQALESRMDQGFKAMDQRFRFRPKAKIGNNGYLMPNLPDYSKRF